ncbi:MAG: hypothetical protein IJZ95_00050 [Oscillospiraceae bacterium]|nr:hypothetical protein [Oscillospiraceae bacterium]
MKDMLRSFRIFTGNYTLKTVFQMLLAFVAVFAAITLLSLIPVEDESFAEGFLTAFLPAFSLFLPLCGVFLLNAIYSYNNPITPGFKYFHSLPDSDTAYAQAIAAANLFTLIIMVLGVTGHYIYSVFAPFPLSPMISAALALLTTGITNFIGNVKNQWVRIFSVMPIFCLAGFASGFSSAMLEDGERIPDTVIWISLGVAIAVYVAGLVYALATCKKKWRRE